MGLLLPRTPKIYPDHRLPNDFSAHVLFRLTRMLSRVSPGGLGEHWLCPLVPVAAISGESLSHGGANTVGGRVCWRLEGCHDGRAGPRTLTGKHMCPVTVTPV